MKPRRTMQNHAGRNSPRLSEGHESTLGLCKKMSHTVRMDDARDRAGRLIKARRLALGYSSQTALAVAADSSTRMVAAAEGGEHVGGRTRKRLERGLLWAPGSYDAILAGGDPIPLDSPSHPEIDVDVDAELRRVIELLPSVRKSEGDAVADAMLKEVMEIMVAQARKRAHDSPDPYTQTEAP